jgi:hypothetical protein
MILDNYPPEAPESPASAFGLLVLWHYSVLAIQESFGPMAQLQRVWAPELFHKSIHQLR